MKTKYLLPVVMATMMLAGKPSNAQIQINDEVTPEQMVDFIVGEGILYDNVTFTGAAVSRGIFTNGETTNLGLSDGIFLTSGAGYIIPGPNNSTSAGVNNGMPGDATLNTLTTSTTYDASVLEFDLIPACDTIRFTYVFGTEEYPISLYPDVFGFFVSGPNPIGGNYANHNIGFIPEFEEFIDNDGGQTLQYDGFTVVFTGSLPVIGSEEYHIKIGIADCGDGILDSGVFIEENSIWSDTHIDITTVLTPPELTENMVEGHVGANIIFHLQNPDYSPVTVYYDIQGSAGNGTDYEYIDAGIYFAEGEDTAILHITPFQDDVIEGDETIRLIIFNTLGGIMIYDTVELIIGDYVEMVSEISPNTLSCEGCEVTLWVNVMNGYTPYSYFWEPGGFMTDTITVTPDTTTTYVVTYYDLFQESGMDSVKVTVFPVTEFSSFGFEAALNPDLAFDVIGQFSGDTIRLHLPGGTNLQNLIASYTFTGEYLYVTANGFPQEPGVTPNNFTDPVIYIIISPGGSPTEWVVIADIETGISDNTVFTFNLSPNPSTGKLYLESKNTERDPVELQVMDLTGRIVFEKKQTLAEKIEIDLSNQKQGVYFLKIKAWEKVMNRKMIIR
jgi:hypothetical protein